MFLNVHFFKQDLIVLPVLVSVFSSIVFYFLPELIDGMNTSINCAHPFISFTAYKANVTPGAVSHMLPATSIFVGPYETNALTQVIILGLHFFFQFAIHLTVPTSKPVSV